MRHPMQIVHFGIRVHNFFGLLSISAHVARVPKGRHVLSCSYVSGMPLNVVRFAGESATSDSLKIHIPERDSSQCPHSNVTARIEDRAPPASLRGRVILDAAN